MGVGKAEVCSHVGFLAITKRQKLIYFVHVVRKPTSSVEKKIIQGTTQGQWKRERPKKSAQLTVASGEDR